MRRNATQSSGFTLIELLVVIAIIAILAAILFPVFAQARRAARKITGVSNTKQAALAILMYSQDFDEYFPRSGWGGDAGGIACTAQVPCNQYGTTDWINVTAPYVKAAGLYTDPDDASFRDASIGGSDLAVDPDGHESILFNDLLAHPAVNEGNGWTYNPASSAGQLAQRPSQSQSQANIVASSDCILLGEGHGGWYKKGLTEDDSADWTGSTNPVNKWHKEQSLSQYQTELIASTSYNGWHFMHGLPMHADFGVFAFSDGHAKAVKLIDSAGNPTIRGTLPFAKTMDPAQHGLAPGAITDGPNYDWQ